MLTWLEKKPTQQYDLRQSVRVHLKSTGKQEEVWQHYEYMDCFVTVGTNASMTNALKNGIKVCYSLNCILKIVLTVHITTENLKKLLIWDDERLVMYMLGSLWPVH